MNVSIDKLRKVYSGEAKLFFYGWIKYTDVFDGDHESRFCIQLAHFSGEPDSPDRPAVGYAHWKTFNCADEECEREDREAYDLMPEAARAELRAGGWKPRFES